MTTTRTEDRTAAILAHLSAIIAMVISVGWLSFVGPLLVWLLYKDRSPFVRQAAARSFNFNIWAWLLNVVGWILQFTIVLAPLGWILMAVAWIMTIVCHILGALRASRGEEFRYPASLTILS